MGFKKANSKAARGSGKVWRKGQSASHNPTFNKFRQEAKKRPLLGNQGTGKLTEALLSQHNRKTTESICDEDTELMSVGGDTAMTAFTNCSLPSFNRLMKNWNAGSFLHKQMLAVLAAVTEILQNEGKKETETEYFAALMTTLDVVTTDEEITAVVCLMSMLVKRLNESVLKTQRKVACETFVKLLIKYMNSDHCALLRNLLTIMYTFFKVTTQWSEASEELKVVLEFTTHHKPKVRRIAHFAVRSLLTDHIPESATVHPCASVVAKFCTEKLVQGAGKSTSKDVFYILSLLQEIIAVFPKSGIKESCETIFKIMTLSNSMVNSHGLKSLSGMFPQNEKPSNLPVDLNAKIITALYDFQSNIKDTECLNNWLILMEKGLIHLLSLDEKLCISHLPKFFSTAVKCWFSETDVILNTVSSTLKNLLETCINPSSEVFQQIIFQDPVYNNVHKMFLTLEPGLSYQYHKAWKHVLSVMAVFFKVAGKHCHTAMMKCLQSLGDLHDSHNFLCVQELEKTIGSAITHIGPRIVLRAIPLQADGVRPDFPRSWLLPLLRDSVKRTELNFFVKYFLPLASKMRNRSLLLQQEGKMVESKLLEVVCSQIWSLLPGFCTEPVDLKVCFREVAQTLGVILRDDPTLRMTVLSALRLLINKNLENEENREEIAKFSKNYLPILFNLYTTQTQDKEEGKVRLAVYETIKVYLQITSADLCSTFFSKAMEKLLTESDTFMQQALIDLTKAMIPQINEDQLEELYMFCKPLLEHSDHTVQKKAYSVMKIICGSKSEACSLFVRSNLEDLRALLGSAKSGLAPATRALKLNCLQCIVCQLSENEKPIITEMIPEAVLCTKENSIKARGAAYELLIEIGNTLQRFNTDAPNDALREYVTVLLAGLTGSPHLMSSTILAIGRVMYEFKDKMDSDVIHLLIENMCLLLTSRSREVVVSALSFLKIVFAIVDTDRLAQHVEVMVKSLTNISEDHQRPFRFKAKEMVTRLVRKFGYEMIAKMIPENYKKQLSSIRRLEIHKKRQKIQRAYDSDTDMPESNKKSNNFEDVLADSDDEIMQEDQPREKKPVSHRKKIKAPCIEEGGEDIVDFLDPGVNKKLLTVNPSKQVSHIKKGESFTVSEDGKLIINDEAQEETKQNKQKEEKSAVLSLLGASKKNKRKLEDSDDDDAAVDSKNKNSSQGVKSGIHRTVDTKFAKKRPGQEYKAKKAGGDVKKGKLEPYAYLPMNRQALNKRKQVKLKGQFKTIVNAAKRGAVTGSKRKAKDTKRKKHGR